MRVRGEGAPTRARRRAEEDGASLMSSSSGSARALDDSRQATRQSELHSKKMLVPSPLSSRRYALALPEPLRRRGRRTTPAPPPPALAPAVLSSPSTCSRRSGAPPTDPTRPADARGRRRRPRGALCAPPPAARLCAPLVALPAVVPHLKHRASRPRAVRPARPARRRTEEERVGAAAMMVRRRTAVSRRDAGVAAAAAASLLRLSRRVRRRSRHRAAARRAAIGVRGSRRAPGNADGRPRRPLGARRESSNSRYGAGGGPRPRRRRGVRSGGRSPSRPWRRGRCIGCDWPAFEFLRDDGAVRLVRPSSFGVAPLTRASLLSVVLSFFTRAAVAHDVIPGAARASRRCPARSGRGGKRGTRRRAPGATRPLPVIGGGRRRRPFLRSRGRGGRRCDHVTGASVSLARPRIDGGRRRKALRSWRSGGSEAPSEPRGDPARRPSVVLVVLTTPTLRPLLAQSPRRGTPRVARVASLGG